MGPSSASAKSCAQEGRTGRARGRERREGDLVHGRVGRKMSGAHLLAVLRILELERGGLEDGHGACAIVGVQLVAAVERDGVETLGIGVRLRHLGVLGGFGGDFDLVGRADVLWSTGATEHTQRKQAMMTTWCFIKAAGLIYPAGCHAMTKPELFWVGSCLWASVVCLGAPGSGVWVPRKASATLDRPDYLSRSSIFACTSRSHLALQRLASCHSASGLSRVIIATFSRSSGHCDSDAHPPANASAARQGRER